MEAGFESEQFEKFKCYFEAYVSVLPKHRLYEIRALLMAQLKKRFAKSRPPKYGTINKGFTESEIQAFFKVIDSDKFALLFKYQAHLGLRVGEAICVNIKNIDFNKRELTLKTEKSHIIDSLRIPVSLFNATVSYVKSHLNVIERAQGYLFYPEERRNGKNNLFLNVNYARKKFREYVMKAELDQVYDVSDESREGRRVRRLHRLTTHSLRHYAITKFAESTNGNIFLSAKFARHTNPNTTLTYINTNKKQLFDEIDNTFSINEMEELKRKLH